MTDEPARTDTREIAAQDPQKSLGAMADILAAALPEVERCLPDWNEVNKSAGRTAVAAK